MVYIYVVYVVYVYMYVIYNTYVVYAMNMYIYVYTCIHVGCIYVFSCKSTVSCLPSASTNVSIHPSSIFFQQAD